MCGSLGGMRTRMLTMLATLVSWDPKDQCIKMDHYSRLQKKNWGLHNNSLEHNTAQKRLHGRWVREKALISVTNYINLLQLIVPF